MDYDKLILSIEDQLNLIEDRGLIIDNRSEAELFLQNISYYRLSGYWWSLQINQVDHSFIENATFTEVIERYTFDRKLRLLIFDAIERIEIALRTNLIYVLSHETDDWNWFEKEKYFKNMGHFDEILDSIDRELKQTKQIFIKEHNKKYGYVKRPPCLKTLEVVSLGTLSKLYYNIKNAHPAKAKISNNMGISSVSDAESWFRTISSIRNKVAHHTRLWNDKIPFQMAWLNNPKKPWISKPDARGAQRLYYFLSCALYMLGFISPGHNVKTKIKQLIKSRPDSIQLNSMGFPEDWDDQALWAE